MSAKAKVSGSVVAGFPSPAEQYLEPPLDLNELLVKRPAATYFVRVQGDSMSGAGISDGDILVVDRSVPAEHNRIVIAALDGELTVKRLVRQRGRVYLAPENPDYPKIDITNREYVHIWGVVTYPDRLFPFHANNDEQVITLKKMRQDLEVVPGGTVISLQISSI